MTYISIINSAEAGGAQSLICNWKSTTDSSHEMILIVLQGEGFFSDNYRSIFHEVIHLNVKLNPSAALRALYRILKVCRAKRPEIIHTHLLQSDLVGLFLTFAGYKVVTTIHSSSLTAERHRKSIILQRLIAFFSNRFSAVVTTSAASTKFARSLGYPSDIIFEIRNCALGSETEPAPRVSRHYFLSLARWHPVKDHATLIQGFGLHLESNPDSCLVLSGYEIDENNRELMELLDLHNLGDSVKVHNGAQDSRSLIRNSIATIISSKSESLSMVVLESMSESTPVITSRVGDHEATVVDSMLIFDIADSVGLAHSMNHVLSLEPSQYMDLQERTLNLYNLQFSSEIWVRNHLDIYRKI